MLMVSGNPNEVIDLWMLFNYYLNGAISIYYRAQEDLYKRNNGEIVLGVANEYGEIIIAFYSIRHALECAIKALIKELTGAEVIGHNIEKLWKQIPSYKKLAPEGEAIDNGFNILKKYHMLNDAQLFRYHRDQHGFKLQDLPAITNDDFSTVVAAVYKVRDIFLEFVHVKQGFPLR
jgi:hypothetical protein